MLTLPQLFNPLLLSVSGTARVYDEKFVLVANISMVGADTSSFVNDVIVTKTSAYFTDSFQPQIYSVRRPRCPLTTSA